MLIKGTVVYIVIRMVISKACMVPTTEEYYNWFSINYLQIVVSIIKLGQHVFASPLKTKERDLHIYKYNSND